MKYSTAKKLADRIVEVFAPACEIINIAGSVRREKEDCGDIEIVCIPKTEDMVTGLFGETSRVVLPAFTNAIGQVSQKIIRGLDGGRYMQLALRENKSVANMNLDIFMPQPRDYWRIFAIRTGSADYSHLSIAGAWKKKGWVGTEDGLRLEKQCKEVAKNKYKAIVERPTLPPEWKSEEEFFQWLGIKFIHPKFRT
jgi:DNA polymerase/3'-5' exonuclease PolX